MTIIITPENPLFLQLSSARLPYYTLSHIEHLKFRCMRTEIVSSIRLLQTLFCHPPHTQPNFDQTFQQRHVIRKTLRVHLNSSYLPRWRYCPKTSQSSGPVQNEKLPHDDDYTNIPSSNPSPPSSSSSRWSDNRIHPRTQPHIIFSAASHPYEII